MKVAQTLLKGFLFFFALSSSSQNDTIIDLHKSVKKKGLVVFNRKLSLLNEKMHRGIRLSKDTGEGIAWFKGLEFSEGIIEFDVRGENVKQHSFVGIAFHGKDNYTFDAIYFRPFHFLQEDTVLKKRSVQYVSWPNYTWQVLREKSPGTYENAIALKLDPDAWFNVRVVIKDNIISTYINGADKASLVVKKTSSTKTGSLGFYVADTSGGDFANIKITKTK
ncbi:MAG: hypothetical protein IAF38_07985 [Bacteroidia bacterium]|nr:hypothetical protein [Bacteroidia bacterium]